MQCLIDRASRTWPLMTLLGAQCDTWAIGDQNLEIISRGGGGGDRFQFSINHLPPPIFAILVNRSQKWEPVMYISLLVLQNKHDLTSFKGDCREVTALHLCLSPPPLSQYVSQSLPKLGATTPPPPRPRGSFCNSATFGGPSTNRESNNLCFMVECPYESISFCSFLRIYCPYFKQSLF